ncbi:MAG: DUF4302 domain-containing protein [Bacteroidaceae bacterium]|nr:DUF4302 domain-containing protein [Bacteroidaceae bacterium]
MKINKIYSAISVALFATALTACSSFQEDDLFDESASLRITKFNEDLQARLVEQSSEGKHGWVIQYFVGSESKGYNLFGRFDANGKVTLASNHPFLRGGNANKYTEYVSSYEMLREDGPVLAFNTWNDILTVFVDPVDPTAAPDRLVNDGEGMKGDNNLLFHAYEDQNILFRGQRHFAGIRFVPCDRPWEDYIADADAFKKSITSTTLNSYYVTDGKDTMYFSGLNNGLFTYQERLVDPLQSEPCACVFSVDGFRMKNKGQLGEKSFQDFTISEQKDCLYNEDKTVRVVPTWDYYINDCSSMWRIKEECFTPEQKKLYAKMAEEVVKTNSKNVLDSIAIGRMPHTVGKVTTYYPALVLCAHRSRKPKDVTIKAYVNIGIYRPQYGLLKLEAWQKDAPVSEDMESFADTELKSLCEQFAASVLGTYKMVPNDYFRPTYVSLVPVDGGNTLQLNLKKIVD